MSVEFHIYPDPLLVANRLDSTAREILEDPGPMLSSLGLLQASIERAFIEQGPGWDPWSLSYAESMGRRKHGPLPGQDSILIREAVLFESVSDGGNYEIGHDHIAWTGEAAPDYSGFHLEGTEKMPERNFLRVDDIAQEAIHEEWSHWLYDIVEEIATSVAAFSRSGEFIGYRGARGRFVG
jgi:hypothetical protein